MVTGLAYLGTVVGATGSAVVGGLMFAFTTAVMPALRAQPDGEGMRAMQRINQVITNPLFMVVFVGTGLVCASLAVGTLVSDQPGGALRAVGGLLYVLGTFGVTVAGNVPLNTRLDRQHDDEAGRAYWVEYLRAWMRWHHVRTVAAVAGGVCLVLSLG